MKKAVIIYSQGDPSLDLQSYYDVNSRFLKKFGLDAIDTLVHLFLEDTLFLFIIKLFIGHIETHLPQLIHLSTSLFPNYLI